MSDIQIINKINPSSENQAVNDIKTGNTELLYARKGSASSSKVVWRRDRIVSITGPSGFDSTWKVTLGTDSENERHENLNTVNNTPFTNATDAQLCESSSTGCNWFLKYGTLANFTITINVPNSVEKYIVGVNININGEMKNLSDYFTISKSQRLTPMVYSDMEIYKEWTLTSKVALTTDMRIDVTFDTYFKFSLSANKSKYDITLNQHAAGDQSQILGSTVLSNETGNKSWYYIYTLSYTATFYSVMYMNNKASSSDDEYLITDFSKTSFANHTTEQITEVEESVICGGIYYASFLRAMMPNNRNQNGIKQVSFGNTCLYTNYTITISTSQVYRTHVKSDLKRGDSDEDLGLHLISTKVGYKKNPTDTSLSTLQEVYRVGFDDFYVYTAQYTEDIEDTGETYYLIVSVLPDNEEDGDGPSSMRLFNSYYNRSITKKINNVSTNVPNVYKIAVQVGKGNEYTLNSSRKRVALSYNYTNESSSTYSSDPEWKHTYTGKAYYGDQIIDGQNAYYSNYFCKQLYVRKWYDKDSSRDTVYFWQGSRTGYDISSTLNKTLPYTLVNDSESLIYAVYQTIQTFVVSINEGTGVYDAYLYNQNNIYGRIDSESSVNYGTNIGGVIVIKGPWYEHKEISGYHYVYYHSYYMRTDREYNGYYWSCSTQEDTEYRTTYKTTSTQKITSNYDFGTEW